MERAIDVLIRVQREWNGWQDAEVPLRDLEDVHWFQPHGAPNPLIHGYVNCTQLVSGSLAHDCNSRSAPHRLLVCVLKRHTIVTAFAELAQRADARRTNILPRPVVVRDTGGLGRRTA